MLAVAVSLSSQTGQPLIWKEGKMLKVSFNITPTNVNSPGNANPYVAGGDILDLTQLLSTAAVGPGMNLPTFDLPDEVVIRSIPAAPGPAAEFKYRYCRGTTLANGTMQVLTGAAAQSGFTELNAGNYPAGVLADVIQAVASFPMP